MYRPGAGTALAAGGFSATGPDTRVCSISAACVAFLEALPLMSSVESSDVGAPRSPLTTVAVGATAAAAGAATGAWLTGTGTGVARGWPRSRATASGEGVGIGSARGGGGTAPGGRNVAVAVAPSSSPSVGSGARAPRRGVSALGGLLPPSTPKLEGASVSRAGSRRSVAALSLALGVGGGGIAVLGSGAVPVSLRVGAVVAPSGAGAGPFRGNAGVFAALLGPRKGGGGGPTD
jgi:hypothetical protein